MKREEMKSILNSELSYIPRGNRGSAQNMFRLYYYHFRRSDLAKEQRGKVQILKKTIEYTKEQYPDFSPEYDEIFSK